MERFARPYLSRRQSQAPRCVPGTRPWGLTPHPAPDLPLRVPVQRQGWVGSAGTAAGLVFSQSPELSRASADR